MSAAKTSTHYYYSVAIVGGGIAGLTLALALEKQGIHYVLLESHDSLAPDEGASIGLLPNSLRVLDQLGLVDEIEKYTVPLQRWRHLGHEGELLSEIHALHYYPSRIGYGGLFLERRKLLEIMAKELKSHASVRTGTRVLSLEETSQNVVVELSDGSYITAGLVIGADGVRSCVREAIDRATTRNHGHLGRSDDYIQTQFACVYGISSPVKGICKGDCFSVYRADATILIFTGLAGTIFWFVFEDLHQSYPLSTTPRYNKTDLDVICNSVAHLRLTPTVHFHDVYANRTVAVKVPLEEGMAPTWHTDRMVIVGDAAHKSTPNAAMGANQAIESSAVLVNKLQTVWSDSADVVPSTTVAAALKGYAELRKPRTAMVVQKASVSCRAQLGHGGLARAVRHELPSLTDGDWLFRGFMGFSGAPVLAALPLSPRGEFYQRAVDQFQQRSESKGVSRSELFGIED